MPVWKFTFVVVLIGYVLLGVAQQPANAFTLTPCTDYEPAPIAEGSYDGPLIDSHFHMPLPEDVGTRPILGQEVSFKYMDCVFEREGTNRAISFFAVFPEYPYQDWIDKAIFAQENYSKRFVRFLMPPGPNDVPPSVKVKKLKKMLNENTGVFQGWGEMGLYDLDNRQADDYPPDAKIFQDIYPVVRNHKLLVYFHPGMDQADNLANVLADNPDINFLVHGEQIEGQISDLMDDYSNVYFTVNDLYGDQYLLREDGTKKQFMAGLEDFEPLLEIDSANWKALIEAHPNQFMWGTDRGDAVWTYDMEVGEKLAEYGRAFIAELDPAVQEKFAYKNARRIIKTAGRKVTLLN